MKGFVLEESKQRIGGFFAILSALLLVGVMVGVQLFTTKGVTGSEVYVQTVNSLALHPIANWLLMLIGLFGIIVLFWTVEAVDQRIRSVQPNISENGSRLAYLHLFTYAIYLFLPVGILHDLANGDLTVGESLPTAHVIIELSLVFSSISCIFYSIWLFHIGFHILKTNVLSKALAIFILLTGGIVLLSGGYEALYGRGSVAGIILSILTFLLGFVILKIWLGIELLRKPLPHKV